MVMHKTQRRVMLKFLEQHGGRWSVISELGRCDLCYVRGSKGTAKPVTLARYISRRSWAGDPGPYSDGPPMLCHAHAQELGLVW